MTLGTTALFAIAAAIMVWTITIRIQSTLSRHEAALAELRLQLKVYDTICRRGGDAETLRVRHQQGSAETWVDLVLAVPGLSLRFPILPDQMDCFLSQLRDDKRDPLPAFLPEDYSRL